MEIHLCDICKEVIDGSYYAIAIKKYQSNQETEINSLPTSSDMYNDAMNKYREAKANIKAYEICENCKKIFDYILHLRKRKLQKINYKVNKLIKREELWEL